MAKVSEGVLKDWKNGDIIDATDYKRERELIRTAINDNQNQLTALQGSGDGSGNHAHTNKETLDKITQSGTESTFDLSSFVTEGEVSQGDMTKSEYDTDGDGVVDEADTANSVDWSSVQNKPQTATPVSKGFMSSSDKTKLDDIESGAETNAVTSVNGKTGDVTIQSSGGGSVDYNDLTNKPDIPSQASDVNAVSQSDFNTHKNEEEKHGIYTDQSSNAEYNGVKYRLVVKKGEPFLEVVEV